MLVNDACYKVKLEDPYVHQTWKLGNKEVSVEIRISESDNGRYAHISTRTNNLDLPRKVFVHICTVLNVNREHSSDQEPIEEEQRRQRQHLLGIV